MKNSPKSHPCLPTSKGGLSAPGLDPRRGGGRGATTGSAVWLDDGPGRSAGAGGEGGGPGDRVELGVAAFKSVVCIGDKHVMVWGLRISNKLGWVGGVEFVENFLFRVRVGLELCVGRRERLWRSGRN